MKTVRVILLAVALQQFVVGGSAEAVGAGCPSGSSSVVGVRSVRNAITIGAQASPFPGHCGGTEGPGEPVDNPLRDWDLDAACVRRAITGGFDPFGYCDLL